MDPIRNLKVGADPELFFVDAKGNPRSAEGLLGGDKNNPVPMEGLPEGFFIQEDNVTAEFNIPPASRQQEFVSNIFDGLKYIQAIAKKNKLKLRFAAELDFPKEQLMTKHCMTFGCNPDMNIWTGQENPTPKAPESMRTAAGHVHIGWDNPTFEQVSLVGRMFDLFVTVPSILVTPKNRRRQLYGKAGACRLKNYGIECRSLDNFWLSRRSYAAQVFASTRAVVNEINTSADGLWEELLDDYAPMIQDCINSHQQDVANFLCDKFGLATFEG